MAIVPILKKLTSSFAINNHDLKASITEKK